MNKFKVWDNLLNEFIDCDGIVIDGDGAVFQSASFGLIQDIENRFEIFNIVNEFGLFKGDIILWRRCPWESYKDVKFEIVWQNRKCGYGLKSLDKNSRKKIRNMQVSNAIEVIGHIKTHKELISNE